MTFILVLGGIEIEETATFKLATHTNNNWVLHLYGLLNPQGGGVNPTIGYYKHGSLVFITLLVAPLS